MYTSVRAGHIEIVNRLSIRRGVANDIGGNKWVGADRPRDDIETIKIYSLSRLLRRHTNIVYPYPRASNYPKTERRPKNLKFTVTVVDAVARESNVTVGTAE